MNFPIEFLEVQLVYSGFDCHSLVYLFHQLFCRSWLEAFYILFGLRIVSNLGSRILIGVTGSVFEIHPMRNLVGLLLAVEQDRFSHLKLN